MHVDNNNENLPPLKYDSNVPKTRKNKNCIYQSVIPMVLFCCESYFFYKKNKDSQIDCLQKLKRILRNINRLKICVIKLQIDHFVNAWNKQSRASGCQICRSTVVYRVEPVGSNNFWTRTRVRSGRGLPDRLQFRGTQSRGRGVTPYSVHPCRSNIDELNTKEKVLYKIICKDVALLIQLATFLMKLH